MAPLPGGLHECRCGDTKRTFQIMMVTVNFPCSQVSVYYLVLNCTFPVIVISLQKPSGIFAQPCTVPVTVQSLNITFWQQQNYIPVKNAKLKPLPAAILTAVRIIGYRKQLTAQIN